MDWNHPNSFLPSGKTTLRALAVLLPYVETKFLRLTKPVALGHRIDGWRVCWIGGWDRCRVLFVVIGDSAEGEHRFRRERDHYSGMIPVSRRSKATLVL